MGRWRARASARRRLAGAALAGREALVLGATACALAQALDNLIVNAIEHGGPAIVVEARLRGDRLRVAVADSGRASRPSSRRDDAGRA